MTSKNLENYNVNYFMQYIIGGNGMYLMYLFIMYIEHYVMYEIFVFQTWDRITSLVVRPYHNFYFTTYITGGNNDWAMTGQ